MKTITERNTRALIILLAGLLICGSAMGAKRHEPRRLPEPTAKLEQPLSHLDDRDSLQWDNNITAYFFSFPDPDGDSLFNVRFQAPDSCQLLGVWIMFYLDEPDSFLVAPNFAMLVWDMGPDSFPAAVLSSDTFDWSAITAFYPDWHYVDLSHHNHTFSAEQWFHIGLTGIDYAPGDTVAFITDNGVPPSPYTGFKWQGEWYKMEDFYIGYNAFFRAIVNTAGSGVQVLEPGPIPTAFHLDAPYPNPFNPTTTLRFSIINSQPIKLTITDILGRTVETLAEGSMTPGTYRLNVDGTTWSSGIYFAHLVQGQSMQSVKLMLVK